MMHIFFRLQTFLLSCEVRRWAGALCLVFMAESIIFSILFFFQYAEGIGTKEQQAWLSIYGATTLQDFVQRRYIMFELVRRLPWVVIGVWLFWFTLRFPLMQTQRTNTAETSRFIDWRHFALHIVAASIIAVLLGVVVQSTLAWLYPPTSTENAFQYVVYYRAINGMFLSFIHYIVLVAVISMMDYHRRFREGELRAAQLETAAAQLETELVQAQLHALKMQIQPHFLFNALNSISSLLYSNPRRADTMIARLGDFLRMTLDNPTTQFISLKQELDLLKCYVDIEMMRFPQRLQVEMIIEAGLQDADIPNLLLQPLVENSIKYGILQSTDSGRIDVTARRLPSAPEVLELTVRDNGPGIQPSEMRQNHTSAERLAGTLRKKSSIGLQNTRARLEKLYGTHFRFDTYNAPEGGFVVYCEIPLRRRNEEMLTPQMPYNQTMYEKQSSIA